MHRASRLFVLAATLVGVACGGDKVTGVVVKPPPTTTRFPGFDIASYPGDAVLTAWRFPTSPYYWAGYYLAAPCHRDSTWMGKRAVLQQLGWGSAVIYVGQQDWSRIPMIVQLSRAADAGIGPGQSTPSSPSMPSMLSMPSTPSTPSTPSVRSTSLLSRASSAFATCSTSLLTTQQAGTDAADAVAKTAGDGFPAGTVIYLDVEYVTSVATALSEYIAAWYAAVLADGRYVPGIYVHKFNSGALYPVITTAWSAAQRSDAPRFWIASSTNFSLASAPTDVGLGYATIWQGGFDRSETWGGQTRTIDQNVAAMPSPSAP